MNKLLERLLMWIADTLDRSLRTAPDLDGDWPRSNGPTSAMNVMSSSAPMNLGRGLTSSACMTTSRPTGRNPPS